MSDTATGTVPNHLTPNQVVAYNMGVYRRASGISQAALASQLQDRTQFVWTTTTVSAAERSWQTDRSKQFDVTQLFALCDIFQVPVVALFVLPVEGGPWIIVPKVNWLKSYRVAWEVAPTWSATLWWRTLNGEDRGESKAWDEFQRRRNLTGQDSIPTVSDITDLSHAIDAVAALQTTLIRIRNTLQAGT